MNEVVQALLGPDGSSPGAIDPSDAIGPSKAFAVELTKHQRAANEAVSASQAPPEQAWLDQARAAGIAVTRRAQYGGMKCEQAKRLSTWGMRTGGSSSWLLTRLWTSRCSSTSRRETGKPFPEASGGRRASHEGRRLRAKGMHGGRSAA
jgi:hypothetical protein